MTNKVLGGGSLDGSLGLNPDFSTLTIPLGRVVQSVDNEGYIQYWIIEETLKAGGNTLANGLYANSTTLKEVAGGVSKLSVQNRQAIEAVYKAQGYNNVFFFEDGFTYTESNDVGIYEDGTAWTYGDAGALPVTVAAGTVPSEGVYNAAKVVLPAFETVADMKNATYLSTLPEFTRIEWQGYYAQSDDGGNWGVLRFGAHTSDGGSIFSIDSTTYVKANIKGEVKSAWFGEGVDGFQRAMNYAIEHELDIRVDDRSRWRPLEPVVIGSDSKKYFGTITANLEILAPENYSNPDSSYFTIKNFEGFWEGRLYVNSIGLARHSIQLINCGRSNFKEVHGRRATSWGVLVSSEAPINGNNNGITFGSLKTSLCGLIGVSAVSSIINTNELNTPSQRADVYCSTPEDTVIVKIGELYHYVTSWSDSKVEVYPAVKDIYISEPELTYYSGGGAKWAGPDSGVGSVVRFTAQANYGVGVHLASLYGQLMSSGVFELNQGVDIVVGNSPQSASYKNTFSDAYFELTSGGTEENAGAVRPRSFIVSEIAELTVARAFNMGEVYGGVYESYNMLRFSAPRSIEKQLKLNKIAINDQSNRQVSMRGIGSGTTEIEVKIGVNYTISTQSYPAVSSDLTLTIDNDEYSGFASIRTCEIMFNGFKYRNIILTTTSGTINGMSTPITIPTPNTGVLRVQRRNLGTDSLEVSMTSGTNPV